MDFLRSPTPPSGGVGWTLDFLGCPRDPLRRPQPTSKSLRIMAKTQNFARSLRSRGSPWVQEGGVGPWTFWEVQGTLQKGGVGPWTLWEVQGTLLEGGVGLWTSQKVQVTLQEGGVGPWTFRQVQGTLQLRWVGGEVRWWVWGGVAVWGWTLDFRESPRYPP